MSSISTIDSQSAGRRLTGLGISNAPRAAIVTAVACLAVWQQRARSRAALRELAPHHLDDIAVSASERDREVRKPFWKA